MTNAKEIIQLKNYIDGEFKVPSGTDLHNSINPANKKDVVAQFNYSTSKDIEETLEIAAEAFQSWKQLTAPQRGEYLYKVSAIMLQEKETLANAIVREEGKTIGDAIKEVVYAAGIIRFYAGEGQRLVGKVMQGDTPNVKIEMLKEPLGVVLVVTPWNFPLSIPAWKIAPAILSGNSVVLKPSSETPYIAMKFMEIIHKANIPAGVVNCVIAPGRMVSEMIHHPVVKAVTFTGSNNVGKIIHEEASKDMKRILLEMGGKNPLIVMEDADLDEAVQLAIAGGYGQTGQACTATGRVIVHKAVINDFTEKLTERVKELRVGNGNDPEVDMGPQVNESERQSTLDLVKSALNEGATLLVGGGIPNIPESEVGFYVEPTLISDVKSHMDIAQKEVFGPVVSIMEAEDIEDAIKQANDIEYGLSAAICTNNINYMNRALNEVEAGVIKVNMTTTGTFYQAPFGGFKNSSTGTYKELGSEALEFYCQSKTRYIKSN